jgi:hypothetical protein
MTAFTSFNDELKSFAATFNSPHGKAVVQIKGSAKAVEPRTQVCGRCWHVHNYSLADARLRHR